MRTFVLEGQNNITMRRLTIKGDDGTAITVNKLTGDTGALADYLAKNLDNGKNVLAIGVHTTRPDNIEAVYAENKGDAHLDDVMGQLPHDATKLDEGYLAANFLAAFDHQVGVMGVGKSLAQDAALGSTAQKLAKALFIDGKLKGTDTTALILVGEDEPRVNIAFDLATGAQITIPSAFDTDTYATDTVIGGFALVEASVDGGGNSPGHGAFKTMTAKDMRAALDHTEGGSPLAWTDIGTTNKKLANLSALVPTGGNLYMGLATYADDAKTMVAPIAFVADDAKISFVLFEDKGIELDGDTAKFGQPVRVNERNVVFVDTYGPSAQQVTVIDKATLPAPARVFFDDYARTGAAAN